MFQASTWLQNGAQTLPYSPSYAFDVTGSVIRQQAHDRLCTTKLYLLVSVPSGVS